MHFDRHGDQSKDIEHSHHSFSSADMERGQQLLDKLLTPLVSGEPRRHHYVPRFFLRRFAKDDKLLRVLPTEPEEPKLVSTKNLAVMTDLYTIVADEVGESVAVEKLLAVTDDLAVGPIERLAAGLSFPPQPEDREIVSMWLGLLYVRVPKTRRMIEALGDVTTKLELYYRSLFSNAERDPPAAKATDLADFRMWLNDVEFIRHQNEYVRVMADLWGSSRFSGE